MILTKRLQASSGEVVPWNKGLTKETDVRLWKTSEGVVKAHLDGRLRSVQGLATRGGFREDLGHFVRSSWEANVARLFKFLQLTYEYEPRCFKLKCGLYIPDFHIIYDDFYVEVKGYWYPIDLEKISQFRVFYPNVRLDVIDEVMYRELASTFRSYISTWEYDL